MAMLAPSSGKVLVCKTLLLNTAINLFFTSAILGQETWSDSSLAGPSGSGLVTGSEPSSGIKIKGKIKVKSSTASRAQIRGRAVQIALFVAVIRSHTFRVQARFFLPTRWQLYQNEGSVRGLLNAPS